MGVDYYVVGVVQDDRVLSLKAVYEQCRSLGVMPPKECLELFEDGDFEAFLGDDYVNGLGVTLDIESSEGGDNEYRSWLLVKLHDVPDGVHSLAFVASY